MWTVAALACASSAFAIRDTMFPTLGRTEPPSAWQAPTRPPVPIPSADREDFVPTGTTVEPVSPAVGGTQLNVVASTDDSVAATNDDRLVSATPGTGSAPKQPAATVNSATPTVTANSTPSVSSDVSAPTTTDDLTTTTEDTVPDDGGGHQNGRSPGGSTGATVP